MAELHEEMALLEHKVTEEARCTKEERIAREAEEAQLVKLEEDCQGRKEVKRGRGTEAGRGAATGGHRIDRIPEERREGGGR